MRQALRVLPIPLTYVLGFVSHVLFGNVVLRTLLRVFSPFTSLRPSMHTVRNFFDARLLYHVFWIAQAEVIWMELMNTFIEKIFGESFQVSLKSASPNACLLSGLSNENLPPLIKAEAYFELYTIVTANPERRSTLFAEFEGDVAQSRKLVELLVSRIRAALEDTDACTKRLRWISKRLGEGAESKTSQDKGCVFSPPQQGPVEKVFRSLVDKDEQKDQPTTSPERLRVPDALVMKRTTQPTAHHEPRAEASDQQRASVADMYVCRFADSEHTQWTAILWLLLLKRQVLKQVRMTRWLVDSLAKLTLASLDEDLHGQVQYCFDSIMGTLLDWHDALASLDDQASRVPESARKHFGVQAVLQLVDEDASGLKEQAQRNIEEIVEAFAEYIEGIHLSAVTRRRLLAFKSAV